MIGQKLGSFRIEGTLGAGAMGVVYRAIHEPTGKSAAVKVVTAEAGQKAGTSKRFQRESEILQQFRHPNIVRFLAVGRYQGTSYFAMEFIQGDTLDRVLERQGVMDWRQVVELGLQLCEALQYAHERGVVHRDLKPSNLMITEQGRLKLTDFGIAKDLDATALTATGRTLGTAAYMAPEQIRGTPEVSHKTDLYALGCLMFQMLAGVPPFEGKAIAVLMNQHLTAAPPRPSTKNPDLPLALDKLIVELMAKDPKARPWDAQAVGVILKELLDKSGRNEPIPMVFGGVTQPTRLGSISEVPEAVAGVSVESTKARKSTKGVKRRSESAEVVEGWRSKEVIGLVAGLVAVLSLIVYLSWPASAESLYKKADALMTSKDLSDWEMARRDYFDAIEQKVADPEHPYRQKVRGWRDRIGLERARRRADVLDTPGHIKPNKPNPEIRAELLYVDASATAAALSHAGSDEAAARRWDELAASLRRDDSVEHPWSLLAVERAESLRKDIIARRAQVVGLLDRADSLATSGEHAAAEALRAEVARKFGDKADLKFLLIERGVLKPAAAEKAQAPN